MKKCYIERRFNAANMGLIAKIDTIMNEYADQGYDMTLRQAYYQMVARGHIENSVQSYKRLGSIVNDARLAGLLDWDQMVDRTREVRAVSHWNSPAEMVRACAEQYRINTREGLSYVECWVEKEALAGVVAPVCREMDISCLVDRGYVSQSAMYQAYRRFADGGVLLYLGDHDPSGIDMGRDISERLNKVFGAKKVILIRLALNMEQVREYNPPPNPAKETDSRFNNYRRIYGEECWELDALEPSVVVGLILYAVQKFTNKKIQKALLEIQAKGKKRLADIAKVLAKEGAK